MLASPQGLPQYLHVCGNLAIHARHHHERGLGFRARQLEMNFGRCGRRSLPNLIGLLGELRSRDIDLPAPASPRYLDPIRQDAVRHVVGVLGVRAGDAPRSRDGRAGPSAAFGQAAGQATDDTRQGAAYPVLLWMRVVMCARQHGC